MEMQTFPAHQREGACLKEVGISLSLFLSLIILSPSHSSLSRSRSLSPLGPCSVSFRKGPGVPDLGSPRLSLQGTRAAAEEQGRAATAAGGAGAGGVAAAEDQHGAATAGRLGPGRAGGAAGSPAPGRPRAGAPVSGPTSLFPPPPSLRKRPGHREPVLIGGRRTSRRLMWREAK